MSLHAVCPNNPAHKTFATVAHVMQVWVVDERGEFIDAEEQCLETTHPPEKGNIWTCRECGAAATVTKTD